MYCKNCKIQNSDLAKFCKGCGEDFQTSKNNDVLFEKFSSKQKLIAAMAGLVLLVVGGGIVINKYTHKNQPQPVKTEVPTTLAEIAPTAEVIPTVESLEIDGLLMSNPEELASTFEDGRSTDWINAGATTENAKKYLSSGLTIDNYASMVASKYDQTFVDALFIKDWRSNDSLSKQIERTKAIHASTLKAYFLTSFPDINPDDKIPYRRSIKVTSVYPQTNNSTEQDKEIIIKIVQHDYDNSSQNRISNDKFGGGITGQDNTTTTTYVNENGKIKTANIIHN